MSHNFRVSDEAYRALSTIAAERGQTAEDLFESVIVELASQSSSSPTHAFDMPGAYDPARDPLAPFLGAFEAEVPDIVRRHDAYVGEAAADSHVAGQ